MDNVIIGQKDKYNSFYDILSPIVYFPKEDVLLITRYWVRLQRPEENVVEGVIVVLCHGSIHEAIYKLIGEDESRAFDKVPNFNDEIERWLGFS